MTRPTAAALLLASLLPLAPAAAQLCGDEIKVLRPGAQDDDFFGRSVAIGPHGIAIGAPKASGNGAVEFFTRDGGSWVHAQTILASGNGTEAWFGDFLSTSGDVLVVGEELDAGAAYVYRFDGAAWQYEQTLAGEPFDGFGKSIAVHGNTILVGQSGSGAGCAYVYEFDGSVWIQAQILEPSDGAEGDGFGLNVSLAGDVAVVAAPFHDAVGQNSGSAYVFRREDGQFFQEAKLVPADVAHDDRAGVGLSTDGDRVVVGAIRHDVGGSNEGAAYVFAWDGASWTQEQKLTAYTPRNGANFGTATHVLGNRVVIGSFDDDDGNSFGAAYVFEQSAGAWEQTGVLAPTDGAWGDWFGWGLDDDGETICVGAHLHEQRQGSAYVYECPSDQDTDGDGLLDSWETEGGGIDINGDGTIDLDLYALGARPDSKDLFVEIDVMETVPFLIESITDVVDAFAAAPVANPDGSSGIRLHAQIDELDLTFSETWGDDFLEFDLQKDERFGTPAQRNDPNAEHILAAKKRAYRYCIFANRMDDGSYGIAELPGNDCYLTLNSIQPDKVTERRPWRWWIAHVFMHELGHTLGLTHGGGFDTDGDDPSDEDYIANYKPNYISVMNYGFDVFREVRDDGRQWPLAIDFSREALIPLDESNLSEPVGIPSDEYAAVFAPYGYAASDGSIKIGWAVLDDPDGVDWNADVDWDDIGVVQDITFWGADHPQNGGSTPGDHLNGFNDWDLIRLPIGTDGDFADYTHATADYPELGDDVITWHAEHIPPAPGGCRADLNEDNTVDTRDVIRFLGLWADRSGAADYNLDGQIDTRDVLAFLNDWAAGC